MMDAASLPVYVAVWAVGAVRENLYYHLHSQIWDIYIIISPIHLNMGRQLDL